METRELGGLAFRCLEGCGFCCTFQPELSTLELGRLRRAVKGLRVVSDGERSYLGLHNKCGACTLLERRNCTQYDLRPAHCRYFPFHVHFAPKPEVNVNYTCRGVERAAGGDLSSAFASSVTANAKRDEWARHEEESRDTYAEFERRAKRAGAWGAVAPPARVTAGAHDHALEPFGAADITKRPFYLAPDLAWLTFEREGADKLVVLEMDEKGALSRRGELLRATLDDDAGAQLPYLQRLARRGAFAGSVFAIVDASDYETSVEDATRERLDEIGADLLLRASLVRQLGARDVADETARFYDSQFLDAPTIGAWL